MASKPLFDDDSSEDNGETNHGTTTHRTTMKTKTTTTTDRIRVNQKFAKDYEMKKQRQELLQHGANNHDNDNDDDNDDDENSSLDSEEDEHGDLLTPQLNVSILKTINALRTKDQSIYNGNVKFFEIDERPEKEQDELVDSDSKMMKKMRKKHFKDVLREQILDQIEQEEHASGSVKKSMVKKDHDDDDDDDDEDEDGETNHYDRRLEYDEEQKKLRTAFLMKTNDNNDDEDGDDDDEDDDNLLLVKKQVHEPELDQEFNKEWEILQKTTVKGQFHDPRGELQDADQFLLDFIKNKKWVDKDDNDDGDYDDDGDKNNSTTIMEYNNNDDDDDDDDSMEDVDRADDFESRYNFRFEEAQAEIQSGADYSIQPYARSNTMETLRRKDDTRRLKRLERQERKMAERKAKEEQLRRLKNAKRQEMELKLNEVKKILGSGEHVDEEALMKLMEGDYDPEKFEELMQATYGDDFYQHEETEWKSDVDVRNSLLQDEDGKMLVGDDEIDGGLYDNDDDNDEEYHEEEDDYDNADDDDFNQDVEEVPNDNLADSTLENKLKTKVREELYKLDYEDIVAGLPTRFKYRKVEPNSFGLTTQEILMARDTTLRNYVSLKKIAPYRDDGEYAVGHKKRRRFREMLQEDLEEMAKEAGIVTKKEVEEETTEINDNDESAGKKKRRRQKKSKKTGDDIEETELSKASPAVVDDAMPDKNAEEDAEEDAVMDGESGKKKRRKKKGKKGQVVVADAGDVEKAESKSKELAGKDGSVVDSKVSKVVTRNEPMREVKEGIATTETKKVSVKNVDKTATKNKKRKTDSKDRNRNIGKKTKTSRIEGVSASRLKAYGL